MKKLLVLATLLVSVGFIFAQGVTLGGLPISVGGGVSYGPVWNAEGGSISGISGSLTNTLPLFGVHGFVDAKYVQLDIGFLFNSSQSQSQSSMGVTTTGTTSDSFTWLDFSLVGKYPIQLGGFTLFPLAGFEYIANLSASGTEVSALSSNDRTGAFDAFLLKAGVGADIPVSARLYIRPEVFAGYKLIQSQMDKDNVDLLTSFGYTGVYDNYWEVRGMVLVGYKL
jgi:hypothetical protein